MLKLTSLPRALLGRVAVRSLLLLTISMAVVAHRGSGVWTDMVWVDDHFDITHRLHAADGLTINRFMGGTGRLDNLKELAFVALYVDQRFMTPTRTASQSRESPLTTLGAEIDDDFVYVYQQWWPADRPTDLSHITNSLLGDIIPASQRFLRIETPEGVQERHL